MSTNLEEINGYAIVKKLEHGFEGWAFQAKKGDQLFAIQQINKIENNLDIINLLIREHQSFPNIIRIYEFLTSKDLYYLVMEYPEGGFLSDLRKTIQIGQKDKYIIMKEIAQGIKQFHVKQLIHGEIKFENIIFVRKGDQFKPKIFDLSLLKEEKFNNKGKPFWQAHEVNLQKKADIWSFGKFCYELQTDKSLINGDAKQLLGNDLQIFKTNLNNIKNRNLANLIESCLKFDQSQRPDINQVFKALCEILANPDCIAKNPKIKIVSIMKINAFDIKQNEQSSQEQINNDNDGIKLYQSQIISCNQIDQNHQPDQSAGQLQQDIQQDNNQMLPLLYQFDQEHKLNQQDNNQEQIEQQEQSSESMYNLKSSQFPVQNINQIQQSFERNFILEKQKNILSQVIKDDKIVELIYENSKQTSISQYIKQNNQQLAEQIYELLF